MLVDYFMVYQFLKRLATPFSNWEAAKTGVIDSEGNILIKKIDRTKEQKSSFGIFDLMILKLKKLLAKVPGGSTKIASYVAALWLIKEWNHFSDSTMLNESVSERDIEESLKGFLEGYFYYTTLLENVNINFLEDGGMAAGAPTNSAGQGAVAGIGVGPQGEPGLTRSQQKRHRARAAATIPDQITQRKTFKSFMGEADSEGEMLAGEPTGKTRRSFRNYKKHPIEMV